MKGEMNWFAATRRLIAMSNLLCTDHFATWIRCFVTTIIRKVIQQRVQLGELERRYSFEIRIKINYLWKNRHAFLPWLARRSCTRETEISHACRKRRFSCFLKKEKRKRKQDRSWCVTENVSSWYRSARKFREIERNCKGKSKDFFGILCSISYDSEYYLHLLLRALYVYHNCVKT